MGTSRYPHRKLGSVESATPKFSQLPQEIFRALRRVHRIKKGEELTDILRRCAGAVITSPAWKPRTSKAVRTMGLNITQFRMFRYPWLGFIYGPPVRHAQKTDRLHNAVLGTTNRVFVAYLSCFPGDSRALIDGVHPPVNSMRRTVCQRFQGCASSAGNEMESVGMIR